MKDTDNIERFVENCHNLPPILHTLNKKGVLSCQTILNTQPVEIAADLIVQHAITIAETTDVTVAERADVTTAETADATTTETADTTAVKMTDAVTTRTTDVAGNESKDDC